MGRNINLQTWMSLLSDKVYCSEIALVGTHDSCTAGVRFPFKSNSRCQTLTVIQQLDLGIRYLDIRLNYKSNQMKIYHGLANCHYSWTQLSYDLANWLENHPSETIFLRILRADDTFKTPISNYEWQARFYEHCSDKFMYCFLPFRKLPQLGDVRGKAVCVQLNTYGIEYTTNRSYDLRCKDVDLLVSESLIQMSKKKIGVPNLISIHARGNYPILTVVPWPRKMMKLTVSRLDYCKLIGKHWFVFDFPELYPLEDLVEHIISFNQTIRRI